MNDRDTTQDMRRHTTRPAHPDTLEAKTRRWGYIGIIAGLLLCVGTVIESLMMADATENGLFQSEPARLFGAIAFFAQLMVGGFLVIAGTIEVVGRAPRENVRLTRVMVQRLALDVDERYQNLLGLVAPLPGRLAAIEEVVAKVPQYPEAVLDGIDLARGMASDSDHG